MAIKYYVYLVLTLPFLSCESNSPKAEETPIIQKVVEENAEAIDSSNVDNEMLASHLVMDTVKYWVGERKHLRYGSVESDTMKLLGAYSGIYYPGDMREDLRIQYQNVADTLLVSFMEDSICVEQHIFKYLSPSRIELKKILFREGEVFKEDERVSSNKALRMNLTYHYRPLIKHIYFKKLSDSLLRVAIDKDAYFLSSYRGFVNNVNQFVSYYGPEYYTEFTGRTSLGYFRLTAKNIGLYVELSDGRMIGQEGFVSPNYMEWMKAKIEYSYRKNP